MSRSCTFKSDWSTYSKNPNHSKLNSQQDLGGPILPFNKHEDQVHFDDEQDTQMISEKCEANAGTICSW